MVGHNIKGGVTAHIARRLFHTVSIAGTAWVYYGWILPLLERTHYPKIIVIACLLAVILFELVRIKHRWVIFGQRDYEASQICAFTWTVIALGVLFLLSPSVRVSLAIALSCAIVDPLLGEMRRYYLSVWLTLIVGFCCVVGIWKLFDAQWWLSVLMGVATVLAEKPTIKWVDDNAMMLLVPLAIYFLTYWAGLL